MYYNSIWCKRNIDFTVLEFKILLNTFVYSTVVCQQSGNTRCHDHE